MNAHRYLRAYMAGIVVPTIAVPLGLAAFFIARHVFQIQIPIERVVIFPMALAPTFFGLWNMLYARLSTGRYLPLGLHGALLPVVFIPLGMTGAIRGQFLSLGSNGIVWFDAIAIPYTLFIPWIAVVMIVYYLIWKYLVGFCNRALEIR
jgi:hypothetical protein